MPRGRVTSLCGRDEGEDEWVVLDARLQGHLIRGRGVRVGVMIGLGVGVGLGVGIKAGVGVGVGV